MFSWNFLRQTCWKGSITWHMRNPSVWNLPRTRHIGMIWLTGVCRLCNDTRCGRGCWWAQFEPPPPPPGPLVPSAVSAGKHIHNYSNLCLANNQRRLAHSLPAAAAGTLTPCAHNFSNGAVLKLSSQGSTPSTCSQICVLEHFPSSLSSIGTLWFLSVLSLFWCFQVKKTLQFLIKFQPNYVNLSHFRLLKVKRCIYFQIFI